MELKDYWEAGGIRPEIAPASWHPASSIAHFLATVILVNAWIAVALGIFYELVQFCFQFGISPWWTAVAYVGAYTAFLWKECRTPLPFNSSTHNSGE